MKPEHLGLWLLLGATSNALRFPRQAFANSSVVTTEAAAAQTTLHTSSASISSGTSSTTVLAFLSPVLTTSSARITNPVNATTTGNTTSIAGTCCYLRPNAVGVNSWYSTAMQVPVATVITTWVQHGNGTAVPQNSTTITTANATAPTGWYSWTNGVASTLYSVSTITGSTFYTTTISVPTGTILMPATGTERFSGVPNTLLPVNAMMYASSQLLGATTMAYELQQLTFTSPTPYLWFSQMWIATSQRCTSYRGGGGESPIMATSTIVMPLPSGIANADFTFEDYMVLQNMTSEGNGGSTYQFSLPDDLPQYLAGIPAIVESWPFVASCTNQPGSGEPTVHIPVSQLTVKRDVTMTLAGTMTSPNRPTTTPMEQPSPSPTFGAPVVGITQTSLQMPTRSAGDGQPAATALPVSTGEESPEASPTLLPEDSSDGVPAASPPANIPADEDAPPSSPTQIPGDSSNDEPAAPSPTGINGPISAIGDAAGTSVPAPNVGDIIASVIGLVPTPANSVTQPVPSEVDLPAEPEGQTGASPEQVNSPPAQVSPGAEAVIDGDTLTANPDGSFDIGTEILQAGGSAVTVDGNTFSLAQSGTAVILNDASIPISAPAAQVSLGNDVLTADTSGNFEVGGQTLQPGGEAVTIGGTVLSLAPSGTALVIDGSTTPIAAPAAVVITIPGSTLTANEAGEFVVAGQTIQTGSAITADGSKFSLADGGGAIVVNGQTTPLANADNTALADAVPEATPAPQVMVNGAVLTANSDGEFVLGSETLSQGAAVAVAGTTFSLAPDGSSILIDGVTRTMDAPSGTITAMPATVGVGVVTAGGSTLSFTDLSSEVVIADQTLGSGASTVVVDGQTLSLFNPSQMVVISGTSTRTLDLMPTTTVVVTVTRSRSSSGSSGEVTGSETTTALLASPTSAAGKSGLSIAWMWFVLWVTAITLIV